LSLCLSTILFILQPNVKANIQTINVTILVSSISKKIIIIAQENNTISSQVLRLKFLILLNNLYFIFLYPLLKYLPKHLFNYIFPILVREIICLSFPFRINLETYFPVPRFAIIFAYI